MTKKTLYLLGILFTIILGCWLYSIFCCNSCCNDKTVTKDEDTTIETPKEDLALRSSDFAINGTDFNYSATNNFDFLTSKFDHLIPISDSIDIGISQLKSVLEKGN